MSLLTNRRRGVGKSLPYDAEVEYLQSNGSQYILTNITGNARIVGSAQADTIKGSSQVLIGSTTAGTGGTYFGEAASSRKWGLGTTSGTYVDLSPTTKVVFDITFSSSGATGSINGQQVSRSASVTQGTWGIFATANGFYPFSGNIYYVKFYKDNTLVADFIPVRIGQTGYMYDKVSKQLFADERGTGFILGPDK